MLFYSPSSNGFYASSVNRVIPEDAIEISQESYLDLLDGNSSGKHIIIGDGGKPVVIDPPNASLDDLAFAAMTRINSGYQDEMSTLLETYPQAETMTFDKQEREAREWQEWSDANGANADEPATPMISAIAQGRSMPKAEIVARVIAKADAWIEASGYATGKRQAKEDRIAEALENEDRATLESITW